MTTGLFTKIQTRLETRISKCSNMLCGIETTEDLRKLTIEKAQELQRFCRDEESVMTKFVQNDLYHLIGMGHFTPPQMAKFTYLVRDWLEYRSTIKAIAMNFDKISALPGLPVRSVYKLRTWDDITLCSDLELPIPEGLPYAVSGNMIQVLAADLPRFISFWSEKAKVNFSVANFNQKLASSVEYGGVRWTVDNNGNYVGIIKQDNVQQLFEGCAKAAQENLIK